MVLTDRVLDSSPAGNHAASADGDEVADVRQTHGPEVVAEHERRAQLDEGDVVVHCLGVEVRVQKECPWLAQLAVRRVGCAARVACLDRPVVCLSHTAHHSQPHSSAVS